MISAADIYRNAACLLQLHHRQLADELHHNLVREPFNPQQEITTESGGSGTAHHWQQFSVLAQP